MITVLSDGRLVTDDIEQALQLAQRLSNGRKMHVHVNPASVGWQGFVVRLNEKQRQLLDGLRITGELTIDQIRERLGYDSLRSVTGILATLHRLARSAQVPMEEVFRREERSVDREPVAVYVCGPKLKESEPLV
jgi:hypothetical protein